MFRSGSLWIIIGCLYFTGSLHAQEEANVIKIEALEHDRQSSTRQFLKYRLQAADEDIYTWGAGIRFQLFTEQNVWIGLDIARGPEESNWYIQIGHPW